MVARDLQADRRTSLPVCRRDRLAVSQPPVEADRVRPGDLAAGLAAQAHDAVDVREQRLGLRLAVAGAEDDQPDRSPGRAERLRERHGRDQLRAAISGLEEYAVLAAAAAEVDHRRPEPAQLAEHVEGPGRQPGLEREAAPKPAALQLLLDRARLLAECAGVDPARVGGQEQDRVLRHRRLGRREPAASMVSATIVGIVADEADCEGVRVASLRTWRRSFKVNPGRQGASAEHDGGP